MFLQGDVSREEDVAIMAKRLEGQLGGLDVLVNCAGIVSGGNVEETSLTEWERTMAVNVTGVFLTSKYAMPCLKKERG